MTLASRIGRWSRNYVLIPLAALGLGFNVALWFALGSLDHTVVRVVMVLVGLAAGGGLAYFMAKRSCRDGGAILSDIGEVVSAGDWVLKLARGSSPMEDLEADARILTAGSAGGLPALIAPLEHWLNEQHGREVTVVTEGGELQRDLAMAREFQQAYLNRPYPRIPEVHVEGRLRLKFFHRYEPAMALGGDFYNIITVAPDCAGVFVADVMGHGTRSALITSMLRTLIGELKHQARNAPHFLTELNKQFCASLETLPSPLFASAYYFVPDTTGRVATYSSAGHPAPFLVRSYLKRVTRLEVPPPRGSALGVIANETFTGGHVKLIPGDVFILFTDGVYEAHNSMGEEFGIARMESLLQKLIYRGGEEMLEGIIAAVKEFVGGEPVRDDICLVAVEVTDKPLTALDAHV